MDARKLIKDIFTGNFSDLWKRFSLLGRRTRRIVFSFTHIKKSEDDLKKIPVIINNRNRLTYLLMLLEWLKKSGMENIIILDNASDYPELLEYYQSCSQRVIFLGKNVGSRALWETIGLDYLVKDYYIYTDADVLPDYILGIETIAEMYEALRKHVVLDKIGLGLHIDDLPDHFRLKKDVIAWEKQFWLSPVNEQFFEAAVDTTFALYAPYAKGGGECKAWRTNFPMLAKHLPWYENSNAPTNENEYYRENAAPQSSHWTNLTSKR